MKTSIYYFSATGNNLSIAKKLKDQLGEVELISIAKLQKQSVLINSESVGFVFPIYAWGIPLIVKEFIKSSRFENVKYTFAVTGCAGIAGKSLVVAKNLLKKKGVTLDAGYVLSEPSNGINIDNSGAMHQFMIKYRGHREHKSIDIRMKEIVNTIKKQEKHPVEKDSFIVNSTSNLINKLASKVFKSQDKSFRTTELCTGCGTCKKICPRDNISMVSGNPKWNHNCEYCTACIHWCPNKAIEFGDMSEGKDRYQKDGISLDELL